ncbi:ubiquitin carboxyl-terminal hydrolase 7-like isoform X2 [Magnolia sinica]|uniref:ubiquitin carboxyl-terminal hydrolase 7-like isoform X2 n=1 Tax=Magnolia sinica TaxID=86752 RepID=UPI002658D9C5|nr:ubiquitin carboxyl-terminal hydrolase 7-like isoform X2 [Magnolia sinica]
MLIPWNWRLKLQNLKRRTMNYRRNSYTDSGRSNELDHSSHLLTVATRDVFSKLDRNVKPVAPMHFWMILCKKYPQFSQQHNGFFLQQDAEECWTQLMYTPFSISKIARLKVLNFIKKAQRLKGKQEEKQKEESCTRNRRNPQPKLNRHPLSHRTENPVEIP